MTSEEALRRRWGYGAPSAMECGLVLVVSPLIALMDDQVAAAREAGLLADALHSNLEEGRRGEAYRRLASGKTQLLYVSPERLLVGDLLEDVAPRLVLAAVDEAHCVSHWGHEFRPEYRRLAQALDRFPKAARMALTATATPAVQGDICAQLGLRDPLRLVGHPDRPNLIYRAFARREQAAQVLEVVRRHSGQGGIVYAQTRKDVERLAAECVLLFSASDLVLHRWLAKKNGPLASERERTLDRPGRARPCAATRASGRRSSRATARRSSKRSPARTDSAECLRRFAR